MEAVATRAAMLNRTVWRCMAECGVGVIKLIDRGVNVNVRICGSRIGSICVMTGISNEGKWDLYLFLRGRSGLRGVGNTVLQEI